MASISSTATERRPWVINIAVLFLGSTILGMDAALPGIIMPDIQKSLGFNTFVAGLIGTTGFIVDGFAAYFIGGLIGDRLRDRKKVLVPSGVAFGVLSWTCGLAPNVGFLLGTRAVAGGAAGSWYGNAYPKATEDAPRKRRSVVSGVHMASYSIGAGLIGPVVAPPLAEHFGWRVCFMILSVPMLVIALIGIRGLSKGINTENIEHVDGYAKDDGAGNKHASRRQPLLEIFRYRNVVLCFFIQALMFATITLFTVYGPLYLTHDSGFTLTRAGAVIAGWGIGGITGNITLPIVSDFLGRRYTGVLTLLIGALAVIGFMAQSSFGVLFAMTLLVGFFVQGASSIFLGLVPQETLPAEVRGTGTAFVHTGTVTLGGGLMTLAAGAVGQIAGITGSMIAGVVFCVAGAALSLFIRETAPRFISRDRAAAPRVTST